jgi:hypothetical protein
VPDGATSVSIVALTLLNPPSKQYKRKKSRYESNIMAALELVDPSNREFVGGDLLAQSLKHLGVTVAFGLHGGHLDAFLMGAHDAGINLVDARHETVAVQAAEGYSKVKGEVGVCFVTANSGYVWQSPSVRSTSCRQGVNSL